MVGKIKETFERKEKLKERVQIKKIFLFLNKKIVYNFTRISLQEYQ